MAPWTQDAIALQVDVDKNGAFAGILETAYSRTPNMVDGLATFDYNWTWYSQYPAGTFGVKSDFTLTDYYFTGDQEDVLAATGAYGNVTVIGTTDFRASIEGRTQRWKPV